MATKLNKLMQAAERADFKTVQALLRQELDVNAQDKDGGTALLSAISALPGYRKTIEKDEEVFVKIAPSSAAKRTVQILLRAGADPNLIHEEYGTPFMSACSEGDVEIVQQLLKAGAQVNLQDRVGESPLHRAVTYPPKTRRGYLPVETRGQSQIRGL